MQCPTCDGSGKVDGLHFLLMTCYRCDGVGSVPDEMAQWVEDGKIYRLARQAKNETIGDAAKRLGISVPELSAIENGRKPKPEHLRV